MWWKKQTFFSSVIFILIIILSLPSFFNVIFKASMIPAPNSFTKRLIAWLFVDQDQYLSIFKRAVALVFVINFELKIEKIWSAACLYHKKYLLLFPVPQPSSSSNFILFSNTIYISTKLAHLFIYCYSRTLQKNRYTLTLCSVCSPWSPLSIELIIINKQQHIFQPNLFRHTATTRATDCTVKLKLITSEFSTERRGVSCSHPLCHFAWLDKLNAQLDYFKTPLLQYYNLFLQIMWIISISPQPASYYNIIPTLTSKSSSWTTIKPLLRTTPWISSWRDIFCNG